MNSVTFFFPAPGVSRGAAYHYAWQRGFGFLRNFGPKRPRIVVPRNNESWKTKQEKYLIRQLTIKTYGP